MKLSSKAVIATLNVGMWRTVKRHPQATADENKRHGLKDEARVDVKICAHPALEAIASLLAEARTEHYRLSLPGADKGLRLLPGTQQFDHAQIMGDFAVKVGALVSQFLADYNQVRADAPAKLNGLYIAAQWPSRDVLATKFYFTTRYLPVPDDGQWNAWLEESAAEAQADLRERLAEAIKHVAVTLADKKKIFRDSLVGNLSGLLALVPDLNLRDDPEIARLAAGAADLCKFEPDELREDPVARAETAAKAADLCSMFSL